MLGGDPRRRAPRARPDVGRETSLSGSPRGSPFSAIDEHFAACAVVEGQRGRRTAAPNPWVGCVIVRDGHIIGRGHHHRAGQPHAEVMALANAEPQSVSGATVYTTLEPCDHVGRTLPCSVALIDAGVGRAVVSLVDPDPQVAGRGITRLRAAGLEVTVGSGATEAEASLRSYLHHRRTGRPFVVMKTAVSIDGRTAAADGTSQWITGPRARADVHERRADAQAVLVGTRTAIADRPTLTARDTATPVERQPLRVVLDRSGRIPLDGPLFDQQIAPTLVFTAAASDAGDASIDRWSERGLEVVRVATVPSVDELGCHLDLEAVLEELGRRGVLELLVEGGSTLHGSLLRAGRVDRLVVYLGGTLLGPTGQPMLEGPAIMTLGEAPRFRLVDVTALGEDICAVYEPLDEATDAPTRHHAPR